MRNTGIISNAQFTIVSGVQLARMDRRLAFVKAEKGNCHIVRILWELLFIRSLFIT